MTQSEIITKVGETVVWWIGERKKKFEGLSHESMAQNPFLFPLLSEMHGLDSLESLADFLLIGHFATGHATGFGKFIDEKVLPNVFGTTKLTREFRKRTRPFSHACFDEIDHIVNHADGSITLLSLKASKWTIQLSMAVQLNQAFTEILRLKAAGEVDFAKIKVGVIYGDEDGLTDKYEILRGINRGAKHEVQDIRSNVEVVTGKALWRWLNNDEEETQQWLLQGILNGISSSREAHGEIKPLIESFRRSFIRSNARFLGSDGKLDWARMLAQINR
jgi:hypothetical protein